MRLLAADIATQTGWAFSEDGSAPLYGSYRMGAKGCDLEERFVTMFEWINGKIDEFRPDTFIYEAPILTRTDSVELVERLVGLASVAAMAARLRRLRVYKAQGSTVTRAFTGRGGRWPSSAAKKAEVMRVCGLHGWSPPDHNAGDALALLFYAHSVFNRQQAVDRAAGPLFADWRRP